MRRVELSRKGQKGQILILYTLVLMTVLVPVVGLAIDGSIAFIAKAKLQAAVDGAAIASAQSLSSGTDAATQVANAKQAAVQFVNANFPSGFWGSSAPTLTTNCVDTGDGSDPCNVGNTGASGYKKNVVQLQAQAIVPLLFLRVLGFNNVTIGSGGLATRRFVRVVLCLDRSSSMSTVIAGLISDAQSFVSKFQAGRDQLGLVVFGGSAIVAYPYRNPAKDPTQLSSFQPPDVNFATSSATPMSDLIGKISAGSNTGTAEALHMAYQTLIADKGTNASLHNMLNVIVLFTDGLPNGVTSWVNDPANNLVKQGVGCTNQNPGTGTAFSSPSNMVGWMGEQSGFNNSNPPPGPTGLDKPMMVTAGTGSPGTNAEITWWMQNAGKDMVDTNAMSGCPGSPNTTNLYQVLSKIPAQDVYGNSTTSVNGDSTVYTNHSDEYNVYCGVPQSLTTFTTCQIGIASWNAAGDQAAKIWNSTDTDSSGGAIDPVIFTIGYAHGGGEVPDQQLIKIIANDPTSPFPLTTRVQGESFYATTAAGVSQAFSAIAAEILRLAK